MMKIFFTGFALAAGLMSSILVNAQQKTRDPYQLGIEKLTTNKEVQNALAIIEAAKAEARKELILITQIPAPPFKEEARAKKILALLKEAGAAQVWIDSAGSVLALRKGVKPGKTVVLDAHLDTVFPEGTDVEVKSHGDTLFAPGIADDSRGLIALLQVFRALEKAKIKTNDDLLFVASTGEEGLGDLRGVKYILSRNDWNIKSWISIDGTNIDEITVGALGSVRYQAVMKGAGGHSWGAFGLGNPHHAMAKAINYFSDAAQRYTASGTKTSFNVGRVGGGTSVNAIPFESWAEIDMRSESPERLLKIDSLFKSSMQRGVDEYNGMGHSGPPITLSFHQIGFRPSGKTAEDDPLVLYAKAATALFIPSVKFDIGSTNSNIPIAKKISAITIGSGGKSGGYHALNEWWLDVNSTDAIKLALLIVLSQSGVAPGK